MLRLRSNVLVEPRYAGYDIDCRLLFMGDRYRQLLRAYPEVIRRLTRFGSPEQAAQDLRDSPEVVHFYDILQQGGNVGVVMRDEAFRARAPIEHLEIKLLVWEGARQRWYDMPLDRFRALGNLLPLLGGDRSAAEVSEQLRTALDGEALAWAEALLSRLSADGFLEEIPEAGANVFLRSAARPRATLVSHTSVMLQSRQATVILDPLLRTGTTVHERARDLMRLKLDAICCSHSHWDHCDVASLLLLDKRTPVVIPKVHHATIFNPPIAPMLRLIGFDDIREATLWEPLRVGDIEIVPVPFHGEQDEPGAEIDHYTYVLRTDDWSLYGGVDAFRDTDGEMTEDLERVRREYRPTIAFLPVSRMTYTYATGGVNGFCREVDAARVREEFQYTAGPDLAVAWARLLDVKVVVPYATFAFERTMADPELWRFAGEMEKAGFAERLLLLRPLDAVEPTDLAARWPAVLRRRFLWRWMWMASSLSGLKRRCRGRFPYRLIPGIRDVRRPPDHVPPGWVNP